MPLHKAPPPSERSPLLTKARAPSIASTTSTSSSSLRGIAIVLSPWRRHVILVTALANCLFAGSILIYSLWAPLFLSHLHYTQMQVNAISSAAEAFMYGPVPVFGFICDRYGPDKLSALSSLFFGPGYAIAALAYANQWDYKFMLVGFGLVGMGTSAMYFAGVTTCAKTFTGRRGLALAAPIAAFGLSSLWMTQVVSRVFVEEGTDDVLDVESAFWFFSVMLVVVGMLGSIGLKGVNTVDADEETEQWGSEEEAAMEKGRWINSDTRAFLRDRTMWWFAAGVFLVTGPGEAFINNMGTLITTLRPLPTSLNAPLPPPPVSPALHVSLIALTSTIARLAAGFLSDYLAPSSSVVLPPAPRRTRPTCSRLTILFGFSLLMFLGFFLVASSFIYSHPHLFFLVSSSVGAGYGAVFSLAPTVVSVVWGTKNFGTNWGIVTMTPAVGAVAYGSLFSAEYDNGVAQGGVCLGPGCSRMSFTVMAGSVLVAVGGWLWVWRGRNGWKEKGVVV